VSCFRGVITKHLYLTLNPARDGEGANTPVPESSAEDRPAAAVIDSCYVARSRSFSELRAADCVTLRIVTQISQATFSRFS
jgi:hypothetical protein